MKTFSNLIFFIAGLLSFQCISEENFSLTDYTRMHLSNSRTPLVKNGSFEDQRQYIGNNSSYISVGKGYGRNGGGGLQIKADPSRRKVLHGIPIPGGLLPGKVYRMGVWVKETPETHRIVCVEAFDRKTGKWVYGAYTFGRQKKENGWSYYTGKFSTRGEAPGTYNYKVTLGNLCRNRTVEMNPGGGLCYDDLELYEDMPEWYFEQVWPTHHRRAPEAGIIRFSHYTIGTIFQKEARPLLLFKLLNGSKTAFTRTAHPVTGAMEINFGKLPAGRYTLKIFLLDTRHKIIAGEKSLPLNIIDYRPDSVSSCVIDARGRTIVNGKPVMMIGIMTGFEKGLDTIAGELPRIRAAGFNCIFDYQCGWRIRKPEETRAYLDLCQKNGLYLHYNMYRYAGTGEKAVMDQRLKKAVEEVRRHPALVSYYMQDEPPPVAVERLSSSRKLFNEFDPHHPTWLISVFSETPFRFFSGCDAYGWDPYPFHKKNNSSLKSFLAGAKMLKQSGCIYWTVPQLFNWANYARDPQVQKDLKLYNEWIEPSANQILANTLMQAIYGAKTFLFYYWNDLRRGPEDRSETRLKNWSETTARLKELEPYLMSDSEVEILKVQNRSGLNLSALFRDNQGRACCIIIGCDGKNNEAAFSLPPEITGLKSIYGKTEFSSGRMIFRSAGIGCDILR